jgi:predicted dehydrogenase
MKVKIGVIGAGIFGKGVLQAFKQSEYDGIAQLVALSDLDKNKVGYAEKEFKIRGYIDYKEMLKNEKLDAVAIVTPDHLHREIAIYAAKQRINLFIEKPLDISVEGCDEIIEIASKNDLLLQVDFHKRFDPPHKMLKRDIINNKLGKIQYGYMWMEDSIDVPSEWWPNWASKSSPVWFLGIHCFDLFRFLLQCNAKKVSATGQKQKLFSMGIDTFDSIQAKIEFENGSIIYFDNSWVLPKIFSAFTNQGLRIIGTEGIYEIDGQNRGIERSISEEVGIKTPNPYFDLEGEDINNHTIYRGYKFESIQNFVNNLHFIKNGGNITSLNGKFASGVDGKEATKIAEAVHKSIVDNKTIIL